MCHWIIKNATGKSLFCCMLFWYRNRKVMSYLYLGGLCQTADNITNGTYLIWIGVSCRVFTRLQWYHTISPKSVSKTRPCGFGFMRVMRFTGESSDIIYNQRFRCLRLRSFTIRKLRPSCIAYGQYGAIRSITLAQWRAQLF